MESYLFVIADTSTSPENAEKFGELLQTFAEASRTEPGCLAYDIFRSVEQPERFISIEKYVDDAAFAAHRSSDHMRELGLEQLIPMLTARDVQMFTGPNPVAPTPRS
ncbi:putative quinol monooxygenase [Nocardia sp. NPDC049149]|uniref:putative quinol monooxygenase n=1 Tax=Nocardia sp. NPDC049149 TaxID=3364315 RepID=UPI00371AA9B0